MEINMMTLEPLNFGYKISTTGLDLTYNESGGVEVEVGAKPLGNLNQEECVTIKISFPLVAEVKCTTVNFYEYNHESYDILTTTFDETMHHTGFYEVINSQYLREKIDKYDPKKRLNLKNYILTGYDCYVELIASKYLVLEQRCG